MNSWIQFASLLVATLAVSWTILHSHKKDEEENRGLIWDRMHAIQEELADARQELAVLRERQNASPSRDFLDERLQAMEDKLGVRLDALWGEIRELFRVALDRHKTV